MDEKRKYPRILKSLPIKLSDAEFDIVTETKNISASGAFCIMDKYVPSMTKLNVVLLIPFKKTRSKIVKKINCTGVVVREDAHTDNNKDFYRVGIYFSDIKEKDRKILLSYINPLLGSAEQNSS